MPKKPDKSLLLKAAELLANGISEEQVAKTCERSRSWVQNLKRNSDFQKQVEDLRQQNKEVFHKQLKEEMKNIQNDYTSELMEFRQQLMMANQLMVSTSETLLRKIKQRLQTLKPDDIPSSKISLALKNASETMNLGLEIGKCVCGIDGLMEELNDIETPSLKGFEKSRGYQPFSENSNRN